MPNKNDKKKSGKLITQNMKAYHDYFIEDTYEAGIVLRGTEVKSIRAGQVNLKDSYCSVKGGELFAYGIHVSPYEKGNIFNHDPLRSRKLMLHKREIMKLIGLTDKQGYTLVPVDMHFSGSHVKVTVALCRGKKLYDKRDSAAAAQANRDMERHMKSYSKSNYDY